MRRSSARIDRDPGLARPLHLWMRGPGWSWPEL